jgi:FkbM family methyltransferase
MKIGNVDLMAIQRTLKETQSPSKFCLSLLALSLKKLQPQLVNCPQSAIVKVNNYKMQVYPKMGGVHQQLYNHGQREPDATAYIKKNLKKGAVVLDIGANIGYYALLESFLVGKQGTVYAVEPVRSNFKLLQNNIKINNCSNIYPYRFAFGSQNKKEVTIYLSKKANWCTMNKEAVKLQMGTEKVRVVTVDSFLKDKKHPSLIRMDVEGFEHEILMGMTETLKKGPDLFIEIHPSVMNIDMFFNILSKNDYSVRYASFNNAVPLWKVTETLLKKGREIPARYEYQSLENFRHLVHKYGSWCPHVFFARNP